MLINAELEMCDHSQITTAEIRAVNTESHIKKYKQHRDPKTLNTISVTGTTQLTLIMFRGLHLEIPARHSFTPIGIFYSIDIFDHPPMTYPSSSIHKF